MYAPPEVDRNAITLATSSADARRPSGAVRIASATKSSP
jgi:hypothetical protein